MNELIETVSQFTSLLTAAAAFYFFVGLVINLAQAQLASGTGDSLGYSRALQQSITMVILLALAAAVPSISQSLKPFLSSAATTPGEVKSIWEGIAKMIVDLVIGGVWVFTTMVTVWSSAEAQAGQVLGSSTHVSQAATRVVKFVLGGVIVSMAVVLANTIIAQIFS